MKTQTHIFFLLILLSFQIHSQEINLVERFNRIDSYLDTNFNSDITDFNSSELIQIFEDVGGIVVDTNQLNSIVNNVQSIEDYQDALQSSNIQPSILDLQSIFPDFSNAQIEQLFSVLSNDQASPEALSIVAATTTEQLNALVNYLQEEIEDFIEESSRPSLPTSPTGISIDRIIRRGHENMRRAFSVPKTSSDDSFFSNFRISPSFSYTEYKDDVLNGAGQIHDFYLTLGTSITSDTDLSFSISHSEIDNNDQSDDYYSKTWGGDFLIQHKLNDSYSLGLFGFYQETDIENYNGNTFGTGGGILLSTYHEFENFDLITLHTLTKSYFDYGHDTLYIGSCTLSKTWNDRFTTGLTGSFTDSLKNNSIGDNTFWIFGFDVSYLLNDTTSVLLSYNRTFSIEDYQSETYTISLEVSF